MKLQYDEALHKIAFNFNLRRYIKAAFLGHHPASSRGFTPRSSIPIHDSDSRFDGRRMLHPAFDASSSSADSSGLALGSAAPEPHHQNEEMSVHRNAYTYAPEAGDPDEGHHTPSTNFDGCHRNCAGHAKRAMVECYEWMDDKAHPGVRKRCREGVVDMMRECKLYASSADADAAMAAVQRGEQDFADPCAGVRYTRTGHSIRDEKPECEVCGVSHW